MPKTAPTCFNDRITDVTQCKFPQLTRLPTEVLRLHLSSCNFVVTGAKDVMAHCLYNVIHLSSSSDTMPVSVVATVFQPISSSLPSIIQMSPSSASATPMSTLLTTYFVPNATSSSYFNNYASPAVIVNGPNFAEYHTSHKCCSYQCTTWQPFSSLDGSHLFTIHEDIPCSSTATTNSRQYPATAYNNASHFCSAANDDDPYPAGPSTPHVTTYNVHQHTAHAADDDHPCPHATIKTTIAHTQLQPMIVAHPTLLLPTPNNNCCCVLPRNLCNPIIPSFAWYYNASSAGPIMAEHLTGRVHWL